MVTLQTKMLASLGVVLAVAQVSSLASLFSIKRLSQVAETTVDRCSRAIELVGQLDTELANIRLAQRGVIYFGMLGDRKESAAQWKAYEKEVAEKNLNIEKLHRLLDNEA